MRPTRLLIPLIAIVALGGCFGGKVPDQLLTLAPSAPPIAETSRSGDAVSAVSIDVPVTPKALKSVRVPAQVGDTAIAYVKDLQWIDTPDRLFQQLLSETLKRTTTRVVLDPRQSSVSAGLIVSGQLDRFGYDASAGTVVVRYDAALSSGSGTRVETRRFEAREPSAGDKASVGPALNRAANRVAIEVAGWIGNHG